MPRKFGSDHRAATQWRSRADAFHHNPVGGAQISERRADEDHTIDLRPGMFTASNRAYLALQEGESDGRKNEP